MSIVRIFACCLLVLAIVQAVEADIYEWDLISGTSQKYPTTVLVPDGAGVDAVPNSNLSNLDLTKAFLYDANLTNANLSGAILNDAYVESATLTGANFSNAYIRGAGLSRTVTEGFSAAQLYSTASYQSGDLTAIQLAYNLMPGWIFAGKNLTNAKLGDSNLAGANLSQANLEGAVLVRSTLTDANLSQANLANAWLLLTKLTSANLSGASIHGAMLQDVTRVGFTVDQFYSTASYQTGYLSGIDLSGNNLSGWNLAGKNLDGSQFYRSGLGVTQLVNSDLAGASITNSNFREANLTDVNFSQADLTGADFGSSFFDTILTGANFTRAIVKGANFRDAVGFTTVQLLSTASYQDGDLSGIQIPEYDLTGVDFSNKNLNNAIFDSAVLTSVNLAGASVSGTDFTGTGLTVAQLYSTASYGSGDLSGINLSANDLTGWNLAGKNLANAGFSSAILTNVDFTDANVNGANFDSVTGLNTAQFYATATYQAGDLSGISFQNLNLTGWKLAGKILANANLGNANLTNADLSHVDLSTTTVANVNWTNANLTGVNIKGTTLVLAPWLGLTADQLYSTASYQDGDLSGTRFQVFVVDGWNFSGQNLSNCFFFRAQMRNSDFSHANLTNISIQTASDFSGSNLTGVDARGATGSAITSISAHNLIRWNGTIAGLDLADGEKLLIRDYDGKPTSSPPGPPIAIRVQNHLDMSGTGTMFMIFEADEWNSTISFDPGIPVNLGGVLDLNFKEDVNILSQVGRTIDLFDWTAVDPLGAFAIETPYEWDLTNLYTTGEVTLLSVSSLPGDFDADGDVDGRDYLTWQRDPNVGSLNAWKANYGSSLESPGNLTAVPEPATTAMLILGLIASAWRRSLS